MSASYLMVGTVQYLNKANYRQHVSSAGVMRPAGILVHVSFKRPDIIRGREAMSTRFGKRKKNQNSLFNQARLM